MASMAGVRSMPMIDGVVGVGLLESVPRPMCCAAAIAAGPVPQARSRTDAPGASQGDAQRTKSLAGVRWKSDSS